MSIARAPLRERVHGAVVGRIVREELRAGERLSDTALAAEMGVSRTPVREALVQLEQEGFLESDPGRGFFVRPLSAREAAEVYALAATLEVLALRLSPPHRAATLALLSRLDRELARADDDAVRRVELDAAWHAALVKECGNGLLLGSLASLRATVQRYELARLRASASTDSPSVEHVGVTAALSEGRRAEAVDLLSAHWRRMGGDVDEWLDADSACGAFGRRGERGAGLVRVPQREAAYHAVAGQLLRDELRPGARLSDTAIAAELGIGRTPVREALVQLEREGLLATDPGRGFFVAPLSAHDLREAAPVLCALEALALAECFPFGDAALDALDSVTALARATLPDPERGVWLNVRWHRLLAEGARSRRLQALLGGVGRVLRRHTHAYWRATGRLKPAVEAQAAVTAALRRRDLSGAAAALERGWAEAVAGTAAWARAAAEPDAA